MNETLRLSRRQQAAIIVTILVANLVIAGVLYETAGWHYIRSYREVTTFLIFPAILIQAAANLLLCGMFAVGNLWQRSQSVFTVAVALLLSALMVAVSLPIAPLVGTVLKYNLILPTPIVDAACYQDAELVKRLLQSGVDPNTRGRPGLNATALHYMAATGETEVVEFLLQKGADPNARADTMNSYPLHSAIWNRAPRSTIMILLRYGADPKLKDHRGRTAFELTVYEADGALLRRMMSGGQDTLLRDNAQPAQRELRPPGPMQ